MCGRARSWRGSNTIGVSRRCPPGLWLAVNRRCTTYTYGPTALLHRADRDCENEEATHALVDHSVSCIRSTSHSSVASTDTSGRLPAFPLLAGCLR